MKWLPFTLLVGNVLAADDYALYDGRTGVMCQWYNQGAAFAWNNLGGDWKDAQGVPQGSSAYASQSLDLRSRGQDIRLDVRALLGQEGIVLRGAGAIAKFGSREFTTPPRLEVTYNDSTTVSYMPSADATLDPVKGTICTGNGWDKGAVELSTRGNIVLQFPRLSGDGVVKAELVLRVTYVPAKVTLSAYALMTPRRESPPVTTGFATQYPGDAGIEKDPRVLYFEPFEDLGGEPPVASRKDKSNSWWARTNGGYVAPPGWKQAWTIDGYRFPNEWTGMSWVPDGYLGSALKAHYPSERQGGTKAPTYLLPREHDELYMRYYIKFDRGFHNPPRCDGGKLPGLSGRQTRDGPCNMANGTPDGYCGWSVRMHFSLMCDASNPTYGRMLIGAYGYWPRKTILYGEVLDSTQNGPHGMVTINEWHCVEERVKLNTPGVRDGILQTWIDGRLGVDRNDIILREALTPSRPQYDAGPGSINGIVKFWGTWHYGGLLPLGGATGLSGYDGNAWLDQIVVATERIGCARKE